VTGQGLAYWLARGGIPNSYRAFVSSMRYRDNRAPIREPPEGYRPNPEILLE
jgi:hypothetical protein